VRSGRLRVREAALAIIAGHPELGEATNAVLARALADEHPGVVATAAEVVAAHPDRVSAIVPRERRAVLDPAAPSPVGEGARAIDPAVARALREALDRTWRPIDVETRANLVDAAIAAGLVDEGRAAALASCADPSTTLRARGAKALEALGDTATRCDPPLDMPAAAEIEHEVPRSVRLQFETDAGPLAIRLDPTYAPIAVARVAALARAGFYDGLEFHRVVAGFVAQFGDPGGDGFGGGPDWLRCQTAPVSFGALDVGVALAGRDTGSSQLFVALARYPHLDGQYAWVGRAEGDWSGLTEGDVIRSVHVEP
jgi:cyclophilin family peptidyl-prolyl cis-trans isomerase